MLVCGLDRKEKDRPELPASSRNEGRRRPERGAHVRVYPKGKYGGGKKTSVLWLPVRRKKGGGASQLGKEKSVPFSFVAQSGKRIVPSSYKWRGRSECRRNVIGPSPSPRKKKEPN